MPPIRPLPHLAGPHAPLLAPLQDELRRRFTDSGVVPVVLLVVLVGLLLAALGRLGLPARSRQGAAVLLLPASLAWLAFNGPIEGAVLLTVTPQHGITVSDLLAVVGVLVALTVLVRRR